MTFLKVHKDSAYFKRFQVRYRRRRQGKTDYKARRRMIQQDRTKYGAPKYRFVVRITNKTVISQVAFSTIQGDHVICSAYSSELPRYGVKVGLGNYAACYATGLLCARRLLTKCGMADKYVGLAEATGAQFQLTAAADRKPFGCILDIGIARTTTGARIFGILKGAVDGGLDIPHTPKRFPGYSASEKFDATKHRARILGQHVADYYKSVVTAGGESQEFSKYRALEIKPAAIPDLWKACHKAIRADPTPAKKKVFAGKPKSYKNLAVPTKVRLHIRSQRREKFQKLAKRKRDDTVEEEAEEED